MLPPPSFQSLVSIERRVHGGDMRMWTFRYRIIAGIISRGGKIFIVFDHG